MIILPQSAPADEAEHLPGRETDSARSGVVSPWLAAVAVCLLSVVYAPTILETANTWLTDGNYSHGFLIIPCSIYLIWRNRTSLMTAIRRPTPLGLIPLAFGLLVLVVSWVFNIVHVGMWSLMLTLSGLILAMYGGEVWRVCRFPVLFLAFAAPLSQFVQGQLNQTLQGLCTHATAWLLALLGFVVVSHANIIEVPGGTLEVAYACSGFNKCISMLTLATFYGYLTAPTLPKRLMLMALSLPIALAANIFRITILCLATTYGGMTSFHQFHDPAEYCAIIFAFAGLVAAGRVLRCDQLTLTRPLAA